LGFSHPVFRNKVVTWLGLQGFRGFYSTIALACLIWIGHAYARAPIVELWFPALWQWWVVLIGMPMVLFLLIGGVSSPNPSAIGNEAALHPTFRASGVLRITRNPVMWAIGGWGVLHLLPNGDLASLILFGGIAGLALAGTLSLDHKYARQAPEAWAEVTRQTSNVPFRAILEGRQNLPDALLEFGAKRLLALILLYGSILWGHEVVIGVAASPPL
jgi:uncharacterized membrane protein